MKSIKNFIQKPSGQEFWTSLEHRLAGTKIYPTKKLPNTIYSKVGKTLLYICSSPFA